METLLYFYKIDNTELLSGTGFMLPVGFTEYTLGVEPLEFLDAKAAMITAETLEYDLAIATKFLTDTDWYFVRQIEEAIAIPELILTQRMDYKTFIRANDIVI